ncbi:MAG: DUF1015 domain-containing protein [Candidatus Sumerlaeota bacterium]
MARVIPFIGTHYNPGAIDDIANVVAPPYDVISPEQQEALYDKSEHNIVRLILGKEDIEDDDYANKYERAAAMLRDWKAQGVLLDEDSKAFYIYEEEYQTPDGKTHKRTGFFAAIKLEKPGEGRIHAHENTFAGPKADRLKLMRATHSNLSPIFCLYSDKNGETDKLIENFKLKNKPRYEMTDIDNVTHRLWVMNNGPEIKKLSDMMQDQDFFIADGHHRYETAWRYYQEMKEESEASDTERRAAAYTLAVLTNCESEGLQILPTHRVLSSDMTGDASPEEVVEDLQEFFDLSPLDIDMKNPGKNATSIMKKLTELGKQSNAFAMVLSDGQGFYLTRKDDDQIYEEMPDDLDPKLARLDVSILHHYIIQRVWIGNPEMELDDSDIFYVKDATAALNMIKAPTRAAAVFLMNGPTMGQVQDIAGNNLRMPHKSTYFYPKLLTGLVLRDHTAAK